MEKKKLDGKLKSVEGKKTAGAEEKVNPRGRIFEGKVIKKFQKRVVIEFERRVYVRKYERYAKSRTKIHARVSSDMEEKINIGDLIKVQECRPLSKIIHFIVIGKIKDKMEGKE